MNIKGNDIRREFQIVTEALDQLQEKFLRANDPTVAIGGFLEDVGASISKIKNLYDKEANNRNKIVGPVSKEAANIASACNVLLKNLGKDGKEDANTEM